MMDGHLERKMEDLRQDMRRMEREQALLRKALSELTHSLQWLGTRIKVDQYETVL